MSVITKDKQAIDRVLAFHGEMCPALAMGILAAELAEREVGTGDVHVVVEGASCSVDAIQVLLGCTVGRRNLVVADYGKNAYTFYRRSDGKAVRIASRAEAWDWGAEHRGLWEKLQIGAATPAERARFHDLHQAQADRILATPPEELFTVTAVHQDAPPVQFSPLPTVTCSVCAEKVAEAKTRRLHGRDFCISCFQATLAKGPGKG